MPLPAGVHAVELRYEDRALRPGLAISLGTALGLAAALVLAGWRRLVDRMGGGRTRHPADKRMIPMRG